MANSKRICAVEDCGKPFHSHGYCSRHYYHFKTYSDPLGGRRGSSPGEPLRWIEAHKNYQGDDCIKWPFEIGRYGYGTVKHSGKKRVASRVMCELAHGDPPTPEHQAAHSCGNGHKACMNQRHLSWKTRVGNAADAKAHGTWIHGESHPLSKMTEQQVAEIISLKGKVRQRDLAKQFGVGVAAIAHLHANERWKFTGLKAIPVSDFSRGEKHYFSKLTVAAVREIRSIGAAQTKQTLAARYGVSVRAIRAVLNRELWAWVDDAEQLQRHGE